MARVLVLMDESGPQPVSTGDFIRLGEDGELVIKGKTARGIVAPWLKNYSGSDVYSAFNGWSNGYLSLREQGT